MVSISPRRARARSESGRYVWNCTGDLARGGGRSLNGIQCLSRRTDTTEGSAPIADHCCQWCDRHPPTRPDGATESVGALSGPFALPTGVAGTAGGLGKGPALVAVLVRLVSRLRASLVVITRRLLLTGSQRGASRRVRRTVGRVGSAVALCWLPRDAGRMQVLVDEGIVGGCASLVECRIQECSGEDRRRRDSSSAGTVDRTSARSESRRERSRLARAGTAWLGKSIE